MTGSSNSDNFSVTTVTSLSIAVIQKQNTHSGYCSDTRSEDYKLVKRKKVINFPIICCHDYINQYIVDNKFVGTYEELITYAEMAYRFYRSNTRRRNKMNIKYSYARNCLDIMDLHKTNVPSGCNGYCKAYSIMKLESVEVTTLESSHVFNL